MGHRLGLPAAIRSQRSRPYHHQRWRRFPWRSWQSARNRCAGLSGYARHDQLGKLCSQTPGFHRVVVSGFVLVQTVATTLNHLPDMFSGMPWVGWPPARLMPMMVSAGLQEDQERGFIGRCACGVARWRHRHRDLFTRSMAELLRHVPHARGHRSSAAWVSFGVLLVSWVPCAHITAEWSAGVSSMWCSWRAFSAWIGSKQLRIGFVRQNFAVITWYGSPTYILIYELMIVARKGCPERTAERSGWSRFAAHSPVVPKMTDLAVSTSAVAPEKSTPIASRVPLN